MNASGQVTVFEAINDSLRESYLFVSGLGLAAVISNQCDAPPAPIAHWRRGHEIAYREIEGDLDDAGARSFLRHYAKAIARPGWTILVD